MLILTRVTHQEGEDRREQEAPPFSLPDKDKSKSSNWSLPTISPETLYLVQGEDGGGDVAHSGHHAPLPNATHLCGIILSLEASPYIASGSQWLGDTLVSITLLYISRPVRLNSLVRLLSLVFSQNNHLFL